MAESVELLVIGNEVLSGDVHDTNSHWICQRVTASGAAVARITVLPDEAAVIGAALRDALARRPLAIVTSGRSSN